MPHQKHYRLVTSRGLCSHGSPTDDAPRKEVDIAAGQRLRLCEIDGPGTIVRFWLTLPVLGRGPVLKTTVLHMYWDGEGSPSVEVPLGDFFGAAFGKPVTLVSARLVITGGAYLCRFEMPFNTRAIIELQNESARTLRNLFFQVGYYHEPARTERAPTFHAQFRCARPTEPGVPFTVLNARGAGSFVGLRMDVQNREWWLRPPFLEIPVPRGFGLGCLEGWETVIIDEQATNPLTGTGAEDYFSAGFYFKGAPFCTPTHGCTKRSFLTGRASAYRFHLDDPIHFESSLDFIFDHGLNNTMAADYYSVAYWYQHEPHAPFPLLPSAQDRSPGFPWINPLQWFTCAAPAIALGGAAAYALLAHR